MFGSLFKFVGKLLGFQSEAYLRKRQAFKNAKEEDARAGANISLKDYITPFSFVLVTINSIVVILTLSESYNFSNANSPILLPFVYLFYILILSGFCAACYLVLNDFLFQKFNKLKNHPDNDDSFPKMIVKILISCAITYLIFLLPALISQ